MDSKILRAGTVSGITLLLVGMFIGTYGAWDPVIKLPGTVIGISIIAIVLSIFLTFVYATWFANFFPGSVLAKGVFFGALIWTLALILGGLFSFFKEAVYPTLNPGVALFLSLLLSSVWGAVASLTLESKV